MTCPSPALAMRIDTRTKPVNTEKQLGPSLACGGSSGASYQLTLRAGFSVPMKKAQKAGRLPAKSRSIVPLTTEEKLLANFGHAIDGAIASGFVAGYEHGILQLTPEGGAVIHALGWAQGITPEEVVNKALTNFLVAAAARQAFQYAALRPAECGSEGAHDAVPFVLWLLRAAFLVPPTSRSSSSIRSR